MKILVATDAWHPQVNGVVRTLTMMAEAAKGFGVEVDFLTPQSFRTFALPSYPDLRLALPGPAADRKTDRGGAPRLHSYRDRRPDRVSGAALLPQARSALHHQLSHPLSRICFRALADSGRLGVGDAALVSQAEPGGDGGDAGAGERIAQPRLSQCRAVVARRRHRAVSSAPRRPLPAGAGIPVRRPRRGGKESRGVSRSRSARHQTDRRRRAGARVAGAQISGCGVSRRTARRGTGVDLCRRRRVRISRARPTPLASCCWRRSPVACRLQRFRSPARAT